MKAISFALAIILWPLGMPVQSIASGKKQTDDRILKEFIVSYLRLTDRIPVVNQKTWGVQLSEYVQLFDTMDSPTALQAIAELSAYYVGEHGSEVYDCLLVRKSEKILPYLKLQLGENECKKKYGPVAFCTSIESQHLTITRITKKIKQHEVCEYEP